MCTYLDLSASALEEAREQWEKQGQLFPATFCELDPCMVFFPSILKVLKPLLHSMISFALRVLSNCGVLHIGDNILLCHEAGRSGVSLEGYRNSS
jgi:hypothetical protein